MGSPSYEQGRRRVEGPVHEVTFGAPFALGVYEVTVAEFGPVRGRDGLLGAQFMQVVVRGKWRDRTGRDWRNPGFGQSGGHPAACVNWNDAQAYAAWLSRRTGGGLPPAERIGVGVRGASGARRRRATGEKASLASAVMRTARTPA